MNINRRHLFTALFSTVAVSVQTSGQPKRIGSGEVAKGEELGFRIERYNGATPVGTLVVRRDGEWLAVESEPRLKLVR